jgi:glycosyltransferase involved in cell wall biosynthesis
MDNTPVFAGAPGSLPAGSLPCRRSCRGPLDILMLSYEFPPVGGGGGRVAQGLARELASQGHQVDVVTMGFDRLSGHDVEDGVAVHRVPGSRRRPHLCTIAEAATYLPAALRQAQALTQRRRFHINHTHFLLPDGFNAALLKSWTGLPFIVTAHGSDVPGYNPHRLRIAHRLLAPVWRRTARAAAHLVCPSESLANLVARRGINLPLSIIPYGFDAERYCHAAPRRRRILTVSRLVRRKGVRTLLQALAGLELEHEVHIVGDGPDLAILQRNAGGQRQRVVFDGWLDNRSPVLNELYESAEIFVLASERENFPVVLLEAMAAGLAIVTTRGTGCAEVVGDTALLVDPADPEQMRAALLALIRDPKRARALGRAARRRVETEFSWRSVAERYLALYRQHGRALDPA